jgi:hypothetical protein
MPYNVSQEYTNCYPNSIEMLEYEYLINVSQEYTNCYYDFTYVLVATLVIIFIQQLVSTNSAVTIYTGTIKEPSVTLKSSSISSALISSGNSHRTGAYNKKSVLGAIVMTGGTAVGSAAFLLL